MFYKLKNGLFFSKIYVNELSETKADSILDVNFATSLLVTYNFCKITL